MAKLHAGCGIRVAFVVGPTLKWFRGTVKSVKVVSRGAATAAIEFEDGDCYADFGLFASVYGKWAEAGWEITA